MAKILSTAPPGDAGPGGRPDPASFCSEIRAGLVGALALYCGDRAVAEELAQEALVRTWERWDRIDAPRAFTYHVAFNLARSSLRRRGAERRARAHLQRGATPVTEPPDSATVVAVRQAVRALPERQRTAIVARFYADLTVAEAAVAMGCAHGTVKALTSQGIANLRRSGVAVEDPPDPGSTPADHAATDTRARREAARRD
jgi:RNA polymerase sigma factor (sigma-70 family)